MSKDYEKLKDIGAQKIHEETHISRLHVQAILDKTYDDMAKIQFSGFISILEREYYLDLVELREEGLAYFNGLDDINTDNLNIVFKPKKEKSSSSSYYIIVGISIFVAVIYFSLSDSSQKNEKPEHIDESLIKSAQANIQAIKEKAKPKVQEDIAILTKIEKDKVIEKKVLTKESNITKEKEVTQAINAKSFSIQPREALWLGYKDLDTGKSYQITTSEILQLDANKTWLLTSGHGHINIIIDGVATKYSKTYTMRFLYKDGVIKKLNYKKYQELNAGGRW
jgi:hypothetical protein